MGVKTMMYKLIDLNGDDKRGLVYQDARGVCYLVADLYADVSIAEDDDGEPVYCAVPREYRKMAEVLCILLNTNVGEDGAPVPLPGLMEPQEAP